MEKKGGNGGTSFKLDRKTVEKNRRVHMKSLCSKLVSLIPPSHFKISKDLLSQQNQISYVVAYINELKERVEKLEQKKRALEFTYNDQANPKPATAGGSGGSMLPVVEVRDLGNVIKVILISGLNRNFSLYQVITIVEEEGGQVVSASFSTLGDKIFHSFHIEAKISRVGVETSRVEKRLQELVNQNILDFGRINQQTNY